MRRLVARICRRLARDDRGVSIIEVALFAPVLGVLLMGVTDLSMGYARKLALEQAAFRALEKVQVGYTATSYATIRAEAAAAAGVPESQVTVENWLECNRVRQVSFTGVCPTGQETSRYIGVEIEGTYSPRFSSGFMPTAGGTVPITAAASVRVQ